MELWPLVVAPQGVEGDPHGGWRVGAWALTCW